MRILLQRVSEGSVSSQDHPTNSIKQGLVLLLGVDKGDTEEDAKYLVDKILNLRIFPNNSSQFDRSILDINGDLLIVSQFTLSADTRKGRRPDFTSAAESSEAEILYNKTVSLFQSSGLVVKTGLFGHHMSVHIRNDGPVTIIMDSSTKFRARRT